MKLLKHLVRDLALRGPLRNWWIRRRAEQQDDAYLKAITSLDSPPAVLSATPADIAQPSAKLRRILFIGDCMWEPDQLFPEIKKICELEVLDLSSSLKNSVNLSAAVSSALVAHAAKHTRAEPDLILLYLRPSLLSEETFSIIRKKWSCPLFGMNLDDRVEFFPYGLLASGNDGYCKWAKKFDLNLTSSLAAVDWYQAQGVAVKYIPQGFNPDPRFLAPPDSTAFKHRFSFVGSWKPERSQLINDLVRYGIHPEIFGNGWQNGHWLEDPPAVFRGSQLNLGIGYALASAKIANAKGRDIECPAVGACYLTTYHWELAQMFEIGKEVLCYRNAEELIELLTYYSKRPEACLAIARAAHKRAHAEHTWEIRLRKLFADIGFNIQ